MSRTTPATTSYTIYQSDPSLLSYSRVKKPDLIGKMRSSIRVLLVLGLALALVADSDAFHRRRRRGRGPSGGSNQKRDQKAADAKAADAKAAAAKAAVWYAWKDSTCSQQYRH